MFEFIAILTAVATLTHFGFFVFTFLSSRPKPIETATVDIDGCLRDLHEKSRASGGKVHIHDVESVLRRIAS